MSAVITSWVVNDVRGAADWTATLPAGSERDRGAGAIALALTEKNPRESLDWVMTIGDATERQRVATQAAQTMAARNPDAARQWIEAAPFSPEMKAQLQSSIQRTPTTASH
jgi:hypothetical protein